MASQPATSILTALQSFPVCIKLKITRSEDDVGWPNMPSHVTPLSVNGTKVHVHTTIKKPYSYKRPRNRDCIMSNIVRTEYSIEKPLNREPPVEDLVQSFYTKEDGYDRNHGFDVLMRVNGRIELTIAARYHFLTQTLTS